MFKRKIYIFSLLCGIFAFALSSALSRIISLPFWTLFADGAFHAVIIYGVLFLVWQIIQYGNYAALTLHQRIINYSAIGVLSVSIWLTFGYGLFYLIFGTEASAFIKNSIWIKGFIGILIYLLFIQYFHYLNSKNTATERKEEQEKISEENIAIEPSPEILERIAVKNGQKIHLIFISEIFYIQAEGDYVKIHTAKGKFLKEDTMKYFQEHLPLKQFIRVHRSFIVNVEMIQRIEVYEKKNQLVTIKNGEQLKVSAAGYKQLKIALNL